MTEPTDADIAAGLRATTDRDTLAASAPIRRPYLGQRSAEFNNGAAARNAAMDRWRK